MSERPKELDWKSSIGVKAYQGFESLSLRHKEAPEGAFFCGGEKVERALDKKGAVTGGDDAQGDFFNFCFFVV